MISCLAWWNVRGADRSRNRVSQIAGGLFVFEKFKAPKLASKLNGTGDMLGLVRFIAG